jgi:hypothetical protein
MPAAEAIKESRCRIEYSIPNGNEKISIKSDICEEDNAITNVKDKFKFKTTREQLNESITFPSRVNFITSNLLKIYRICKELKLDNPDIIKNSFKILEKCTLSGKTDIITSKTSQNEVLIYRSSNGTLNNVLIDEEGDISFIKIGKTLSEKQIDFFSNETPIDFNKVVSFL